MSKRTLLMIDVQRNMLLPPQPVPDAPGTTGWELVHDAAGNETVIDMRTPNGFAGTEPVPASRGHRRARPAEPDGRRTGGPLPGRTGLYPGRKPEMACRLLASQALTPRWDGCRADAAARSRRMGWKR
jgi:hypothetical protein